MFTSFTDVSKASDPAVGAVDEHTLTGSQTHRPDVVSEGDWGTELKQSNVVVAGEPVVIGMADDRSHSAANSVGVATIQALKTQENRQATGDGAETMTTERPIGSELEP